MRDPRPEGGPSSALASQFVPQMPTSRIRCSRPGCGGRAPNPRDKCHSGRSRRGGGGQVWGDPSRESAGRGCREVVAGLSPVLPGGTWLRVAAGVGEGPKAGVWLLSLRSVTGRSPSNFPYTHPASFPVRVGAEGRKVQCPLYAKWRF